MHMKKKKCMHHAYFNEISEHNLIFALNTPLGA